MELKKILNGIENYKSKGDLDIDILSIEDNSKNVKPGSLFVAVQGYDFDGHDFVKEAIENGATAVILDMNANLKGLKVPSEVTVILVQNSRIALAIIACNFYGNPSSKFTLIGVNGTKGKTTTTYMIKSILEKMGKKVGLIGTIANYIGDECLGESSRTTPGSIELQKTFSMMVKAKVDFVVMEVSSQSLKLHRVDGIDFDLAVFTNLSEDHISAQEHPDMEDYFNAKLKLIEMSKKSFINSDDFHVRKVLKRLPEKEIKTYGVDNEADNIAKDITITNSSVDFKMKINGKNERIKTGIPGRFSVYNSLAAICISVELWVTAEEIKEALLNIRVPGRSELVPNKKDLVIMIDYAHSPESLQSILSAVKSYTRGRVISVFGCGGDRDKSKRPIMGKISTSIADFSIITSDNPRTENPETIVKEIEEGAVKTKGKYITIVDRTEAIKYAIDMATKNDIIVLAGKGHETYQEINGEKRHYDEREIIKEVI